MPAFSDTKWLQSRSCFRDFHISIFGKQEVNSNEKLLCVYFCSFPIDNARDAFSVRLPFNTQSIADVIDERDTIHQVTNWSLNHCSLYTRHFTLKEVWEGERGGT